MDWRRGLFTAAHQGCYPSRVEGEEKGIDRAQSRVVLAGEEVLTYVNAWHVAGQDRIELKSSPNNQEVHTFWIENRNVEVSVAVVVNKEIKGRSHSWSAPSQGN
jgi:hypothetical protein